MCRLKDKRAREKREKEKEKEKMKELPFKVWTRGWSDNTTTYKLTDFYSDSGTGSHY